MAYTDAIAGSKALILVNFTLVPHRHMAPAALRSLRLQGTLPLTLDTSKISLIS